MGALSIGHLATLAAEIPTGILSDKIGRKKTANLGALVKVIGLILIALSNSSNIGIATLLLGVMFSGVSGALFSGNNNALLYETLQNLGKSDRLHKFLGKKIDFAIHSALFISCIIGGFLAFEFDYTFVLWMTVIPNIICLFISFFFTETQTYSLNGLRALVHLKRSLKGFGVKKNSLKIFAVTSLESIQQAVYRMEIVFIKTLMPLWGIGIYKGLVHLALSISFFNSGKIIEKQGHKKSAIEGQIIFAIIQVIAYSLTIIISPALLIISYLFKGYSQNATKVLVLHSLSNKERATMDSILSMSNSLIASFMFIIMGLLAEYMGLSYAAITLIIFRMLLVIPLLSNYFKKEETKEA